MSGLIEVLKKFLKGVASVQSNYLGIVLVILLMFTVFTGIGITKIELQSDLSKLDPQDLDFTKLNNKIKTEFNEFESVVILVELDEDTTGENLPIDIRDPRVMEFLVELDGKLRAEPTIQEVQSAGQVFSQFGVPDSLEGVKSILNLIPEVSGAFDSQYKWTVVFIEADVGGDDVKIKALNDRIDEILKETTIPGGIRVTTTGDAPLNSAIFTLLIQDAFFTLIFSTLAIFLLVLVLERSFKRAIIILLPLGLGLIWTAGTMGWIGIPITIATAAMGAMLLGLGVEYSIFLFSRYHEERHTRRIDDALRESLVNVGSTLVSSGTTTLMGFMALYLSIFPVLSDLGLTLAIGIAFMLAATIFALPVVILIEDRIETKLKGEKEMKHQLKVEDKGLKKLKISNGYAAYGKLVANRPVFVLIIALLITGAMFYGITQIVNQDVDFETILPNDLEEIIGYIKINDEFGTTNALLVYVEVYPSFLGSDEPIDVRDPRVLEYVDLLQNKLRYINNADESNSVADLIKQQNDGIIPDTIASQQELFETGQARRFVNSDYSATIIRVSVRGENVDDAREAVRQAKEIIEDTRRPAGINVRASGNLVVQSELDALNGPDSQRTSLIAFAGIIVFLYVLTRSFKSTFLPLFTVILGIIWTLGLTGFFRVPFNNITSSVITMTIGIGIDFGLQVVNRFNQELETHEKKKSMELTITSILTPMIITTIAALIGFRAMGLGQLKIMGDLGILMSFGILASMLAAISGVAALTMILQRDSPALKNKNTKSKTKIKTRVAKNL